MNFYEKNKKLIWLGVILLGAVVIYRAIKKRVNPLLTKNKPLVVAKGARLGKNVGLQIDNSLTNIEALLKAKVDVIEISIQLSADNVPFLFKDKTLDNLTNGFGFVNAKSANQLKTYSYKADPNEKIATLSDALMLLKKYNENAIFFISNLNDYNYFAEITTLNEKGFFKGFENNFLLRGATAEKPVAIYNAGLMYMNTVPFEFVGKLNNNTTVNQLVKRSSEADFLRVQFNDKDTFVINGKLADFLDTVNCKIWIDPLNTKLAIPKELRGDTAKEWNAILKSTKAKAIVTNYPIELQSKLNS